MDRPAWQLTWHPSHRGYRDAWGHDAWGQTFASLQAVEERRSDPASVARKTRKEKGLARLPQSARKNEGWPRLRLRAAARTRSGPVSGRSQERGLAPSPGADPVGGEPTPLRAARTRSPALLRTVVRGGRSTWASVSTPSAVTTRSRPCAIATIAETMARLLRLLLDLLHELAVDLHAVDREAAQVAERGVAGAEVVDGDAHAELAQLARAWRSCGRC